MSAPRQTLSYLRNLLEAHGIRLKNKLGQNFLIDLNLLDLIVRSAELSKEDLVLEVGSGTGTLTGRLAEAAGAVVAVEIDEDFYKLTRELAVHQPHVRVLHVDALRNKNEMNPAVMAALEEQRRSFSCSRLKLVANLPYVVATPVICNLLLGKQEFERMVVTVQWEIAERMLAQPGEKAHGALAVLVQSVTDVEIIRRLAPAVFWPRPQVDSAIAKIVPNKKKREKVGDAPKFRVFLRDLYTHRRKNLRSALAGWPSGRRDKAEVDRKLAELEIDGNIRAEELDVETHLRLCAAFG
ncbi:MAG TPA: 16S rRNA (adenine(1518)-N(6)/adenine(1519)-N(6))-dimethyltransferase RsmA [Gemmataceae bacterium]|jgi:16S rRNA (adenine1518-N6/adenine1519-N6)-dimethyltransferase|nr:16S rRNA (adenine(1518)-N(6)/adenine(1519)-N(6))-dimethyltransferase RsmA [Gemmataceae bacterium]